MLNIYLSDRGMSEKDLNRIVKSSDLWFKQYVTELPKSDTICSVIKNIDGVDYLGDRRITPKYGKEINLDIECLSSGCKAVLNVLLFPNKIFNSIVCGQNAIDELLKLDSGNIIVYEAPSFRSLNKPVNFILSGNSFVVDNSVDADWMLINGGYGGVVDD